MAPKIVEKAALTDVGRQLQSNEDSYLERSPLFVVADGMGGARAGEVASRMAIEQFDAQDGSDTPPEVVSRSPTSESGRARRGHIEKLRSRHDSPEVPPAVPPAPHTVSGSPGFAPFAPKL